VTLLKLDIDGPIPRGFFFRLMHCVKLWQCPIETVRYDRTRHGWHVIVAVDVELSNETIVAAQAILGSDPKREAFNLMRCRYLRLQSKFWRARFNVLYKSHSHGVKIA
jgi:hypothetical protein